MTKYEMNSKKADEAIRALKYVSRGKPGREEYDAQHKAIESEWKAWLNREYANDLPDVLHGEIFYKAWEDGHSEGYYSVEWHYEELADFAREVIAAYRDTH